MICLKVFDIRTRKILLICAQLAVMPLLIFPMVHVLSFLVIYSQNSFIIFFLQVLLNDSPWIINDAFDLFESRCIWFRGGPIRSVFLNPVHCAFPAGIKSDFELILLENLFSELVRRLFHL